MSFTREEAVDRLGEIVATVESDRMPVPIREVWVYGDVVLGLDPVERLDVYLTKDLLFKDNPEREAEFEERLGVRGIGKTVAAEWADAHPEFVRANANGHVAPEKCLAAHLLSDGEPIHLEVCNTGFENNVTQRLKGARAREEYAQLLDPRAACLWVSTEASEGDGRDRTSADASAGMTSEEAFRKLRTGAFVFPTLSGALEMLGMGESEAKEAAEAVSTYRKRQEGVTVRGDVV